MKTGILFFLMSFGVLLGGVDPETIHRQKDFPLIHGLAESMTGKVVYQSVDHVIKGAEPIIIRKNYYTDMPDDALDGGWCFFPDLRLHVVEYYDANLFPHKGPEGASIYMEDLNGRKHYFYYSGLWGSENIHCYESIVNHKQTFYRNTMADEISGRTNPRNMKLEIEWGKKAILYLGDGTRKEYHYENADQTEDRLKTRFKYKLQKEIKPNKNIVLYRYGKFGRLEKIETRDPSSTKVYATATLEYRDTKHCKKNRDFVLKGNGKVLGEYKFWRPDDKSQKFAHNTFYLSDCHETFRNMSLLSKKYGYDNGIQATGESKEPLLQGNKYKKAKIERNTTRLPYLNSINEQGKLSLLGYYNVKDCIINNGERSYIKSSYDHRFSRIKSIFTIDPLNPIAKEEAGVKSEKWINSWSKTKYTGLYRFEYVLEPSDKADKYKKVVQAKVKNIVNDDLMIFSFENENKPERFEHIFSDGFGGKNHYVENYFWMGMSTEKYIAISKVLYEDIKNKNSSFFIKYDYGNDYINNLTVGNIQQKKITGNLTGQSSNNETYQIDYTYTGGRYSFNLPKTKKETCRLSIDYTYKYEKPSYPNQVNLEVIADLLTSKITYDEVSKEIYKREYFEYNSDNILIRKITDNGKTHAEKFDPSHAGKICKITEIIPVNVKKACNLPEQVIEKYLENGEEHTLLVHKYRYNDLHEVEEEEVCAPDGKSLYTLTYKYAENGLLLLKSDPIGRKTFYEYATKDGWIFHRLRSINDEALPYSEHYSYDIAGNPQKKTQKPKGGNNPARDFFSSHDVFGNKVSETDFRGNYSAFSYDGRGNQTRQTTSLDNDTLITKTKYDAFGNPILLIDAKGYQTKKKYNTYGSVTEIIYPDNTKETFHYTLNNLLETHIDQTGTKTVYKYDSSGNHTCKKVFDREGNLISLEEKVYDGFALKHIIDAEENKTEYFYDGAGRKIAEEFTDSKTAKISRVEYAYDVYGNVYSKAIINDSNTLFSITEKDKVGRVLEEREEDTEGNIYSLVNYTYDKTNNKKTATSYVDSREIISKFTYDSFNRLTSTEYPGSISYKISYSDRHPNEHGKKVLQEVHIDPLNIQTTNTYDNLGNLKSTEMHNASKTLLSREEFYYDKNLNQTLQKSFVYADGESIRQVELKRAYNNMNRVQKMIEAANTSDKKTTSYRYYPNGQLQVLTKPDGTRLHWTYDALGFETSLKSEGGLSDEHISYEYQYTKLGALQSSTNLFTGRSTLRELDGSGKILSETLENGLTNSYEYDNAGRETRVILFDGSTIEKEYGPAYLRKVIRKDSDENIIHTHYYNSYDLSGNLLEESFGEDTVSYSFDHLGRIVSVDSPYFSQTVTEYDLKGKIKSMQLQDELYAFEYDDLEQLISERGRFTHDYLFDSHNNPLSKDGGEYEVNHLNQIKQTPDADYTFDDNGNTLAKVSDKTVEFDYDALDRLIRVRKEGLVPVQYIYDSLHRRVIKNREDKDILYLYQNQNEVGEVEDNCLMTFRTLGLTGMAELGSAIFMELYEKHCIPLYDLSLNVAELISKDQESVESYRYNAFGQEEVESQYRSIINPWRFSSKRTDAETGYVYFGRRYYDAELGRWTTKDPKGYEEGVNLYAYGLNNPLTVHDLYGLEIDYARPTFFENEVQPFRCYARGFCEFSAEALVRPMDMFHMGIAPPDINGNYIEPLRPSEVLLSSYRTHLDKVLPYNTNSSTNINMVASTKAALESLLVAFSGGMSQAGKAYQYAYAYGASTLNTGMVQGMLGPVVSAFSSVLHKNGVKEPSAEQKDIEKAEREFAKESNNWTKGSLFKNKTAEELHQMFEDKKYFPIGDDPKKGLGSYIHETTGRKLYIDPKKKGTYREPSHVDIFRAKKYNGQLRKKRMIYKDE